MQDYFAITLFHVRTCIDGTYTVTHKVFYISFHFLIFSLGVVMHFIIHKSSRQIIAVL